MSEKLLFCMILSIQSTPANKSGVTAGKKTSDNITSLALTLMLIIAKKVPNVDNPKDIIMVSNKYSILSILILNRIDVIGNAKIDEIRTSIKLLVNLPKKIISLDIGDKINASSAPFSTSIENLLPNAIVKEKIIVDQYIAGTIF